jgi:hypothetical protein
MTTLKSSCQYRLQARQCLNWDTYTKWDILNPPRCETLHHYRKSRSGPDIWQDSSLYQVPSFYFSLANGIHNTKLPASCT